jgi:hypothetical protein
MPEYALNTLKVTREFPAKRGKIPCYGKVNPTI